MAVKLRCARSAPVVVNTSHGAIVFRPDDVVVLESAGREIERAIKSGLIELVVEPKGGSSSSSSRSGSKSKDRPKGK